MHTPRISLIAAVSTNGVIGRNNTIPWRLPSDMEWFARQTRGHPVLMGQTTYEGLPEQYRPLPNRRNIVLTLDRTARFTGAEAALSFEDVFLRCRDEQELFVAGGASVYAQAYGYADRFLLTHVEAIIPGDAYLPFPASTLGSWRLSYEERVHDDRDEHPSVRRIYDRARAVATDA